MMATMHCDMCHYREKHDDENMPDHCPRCGYNFDDESTSGYYDDGGCDTDYDDDYDPDNVAEFGGMPDGY